MKQQSICLSRVAALGLLPAAGNLLAQSSPSAEDAAGALGCLACGGTMLAIPVIFLVLNILLLIWVAKDAKSRGMDAAVGWMVLVMFTSVIGLVIYIFARPQGALISCAKCGNKRLESSATCPHCANA